MVSLEDPAALLGEELLGEALEVEPLEELGLEDEPEAPGVDEELEELGLLLLGELMEPDDEPDDDEPGEDIEPLERLEPEAPVVELAPRSQP